MNGKRVGIAAMLLAAVSVISSAVSLVLYYNGKNELEDVGSMWGGLIVGAILLILGLLVYWKDAKQEKEQAAAQKNEKKTK